MTMTAPAPLWHVIAILIARLVFAGLFAMAAIFKFVDINATAGYIAGAGFPIPLILAWCAALFEAALVICFLSGAYFTEASLLAAIYVIFLAFSFHGPSHWEGNQYRVRLLHRSFHLHGRPAVRRRAWPGRQAGAAQEPHRQGVGLAGRGTNCHLQCWNVRSTPARQW